MSVTANPVPAVWVTGVETPNRLVVLLAMVTVKLPDVVPVIEPSFAVSVVDTASKSVMGVAVPTPELKLTELG